MCSLYMYVCEHTYVCVYICMYLYVCALIYIFFRKTERQRERNILVLLFLWKTLTNTFIFSLNISIPLFLLKARLGFLLSLLCESIIVVFMLHHSPAPNATVLDHHVYLTRGFSDRLGWLCLVGRCERWSDQPCPTYPFLRHGYLKHALSIAMWFREQEDDPNRQASFTSGPCYIC